MGENLLGVAQVVGEDVMICRTPCPQMLFNVYLRLPDPYKLELPDPDPGPYFETDPDLICYWC